MKKLLLAFLIVTVTACASNPATYKSTTQNYRPKGETEQVKIDAVIAHKKNLLDDDYAAMFYINDSNVLFFQLDRNGKGSFSCNAEQQDSAHLYHCVPPKNHKIGANCLGSTVNGRLTGASCSFSYDDEVAANFTF